MGAKQANGLTMQELEMVKLYLDNTSPCFGNYSACFKKVYDKNNKLCDVSIWTKASLKFNEPHIKEYIKEKVDGEITEEWIKSQIRDIATSPTAQYRDKLKAQELLGKTKAMFTDKTEVDLKVEGLILEEDNEI